MTASFEKIAEAGEKLRNSLLDGLDRGAVLVPTHRAPHTVPLHIYTVLVPTHRTTAFRIAQHIALNQGGPGAPTQLAEHWRRVVQLAAGCQITGPAGGAVIEFHRAGPAGPHPARALRREASADTFPRNNWRQRRPAGQSKPVQPTAADTPGLGGKGQVARSQVR